MMEVLTILIIIQFILVAFGIRNNWVWKTRYELIQSDYDKFRVMPSYKIMLLKFWIWDINKFAKGDK